MASPQQGQGQGQAGGWTAEQFWSLLDKADRRYARVRDLPLFGRQEPEEYGKAFRIYTQLWRMQQEHRPRLLDAGLRRWQVGEIAACIAHLYYSQYQRTSDTALLSEAFVFYHAVLDRDYFLPEDHHHHHHTTKHLRFLARFILIALLLARRAHTVPRLAVQITALLEESKKTLQEAEYKEWKHVGQEIARFLRADSSFMNMRPLRYSYAFDPTPETLPSIPPTVKKRGLLLSDAILCSYHHNEVKFTDLTIDVFRMLQCLEWEPCGSFALNDGYTAHDETGPNLLKDLRDAALPPNPLKTVLRRPSVTHFLKVLATKCEELPSNGMLLIYLSAAGKVGSSGFCSDTSDKVMGNFSKFDISNASSINPKEDKEPCLWLGSRESEGSNSLYPCDLIPFTRRPLFLVIDSSSSYAFKSINGAEKGETTAMLLSARSPSCAVGFSGDSTRSTRQSGSQFTMFLTAPLQAFCFLIGNNGLDIVRDSYNKAEELLSLSLNEWAMTLVASSSLDPIWVEVLGDPLLRRLLLRFIFCRATFSLLKASNNKAECLPTCVPPLPESVAGESMLSQCCVMRVASYLGAADQFSFAEAATWPDVDDRTGAEATRWPDAGAEVTTWPNVDAPTSSGDAGL